MPRGSMCVWSAQGGQDADPRGLQYHHRHGRLKGSTEGGKGSVCGVRARGKMGVCCVRKGVA
jgi:hypothetical protein